DLNHQRQIANLIAHRAMLEHQQGDDAAAVKDFRRVLFQSDAVENQGFLVSHLVANGCRALVSNTIQQMGLEMKIGSETGAVPPKQIKELIASLLDDKGILQGRRRAMLCERMAELDSARCIDDGRLSLSALTASRSPLTPGQYAAGIAMRPIALADGLSMIRFTTEVLR